MGIGHHHHGGCRQVGKDIDIHFIARPNTRDDEQTGSSQKEDLVVETEFDYLIKHDKMILNDKK